MNTVCKYAVVRFMPFAETLEFANVGVVIAAPKLGIIEYKLAPSRFARVTHFFDDLDGRLYRKAVERFDHELARIRQYGATLRGQAHVDFFNEITRYRESVVHFGEVRTIATENPVETLEQLYDKYVGRNFVTKEYREAQMLKLLRQDLGKHVAVKYHQRELQADFGPVTLPLVAEVGGRFRAIKPMAFHQHKPLELLEHGDKWVNRIKLLIQAGTIEPENMMFTVEAPEHKDVQLGNAFARVVTEMEGEGMAVIPFENKPAIRRFAAHALSPDEFQLRC